MQNSERTSNQFSTEQTLMSSRLPWVARNRDTERLRDHNLTETHLLLPEKTDQQVETAKLISAWNKNEIQIKRKYQELNTLPNQTKFNIYFGKNTDLSWKQ